MAPRTGRARPRLPRRPADVHPRRRPTWELPDAQFLQINWEVLDEGAIGLTPPSLHPSIPPFASFFAGHYPESPVGPFSLVQVRLVVRAGIRPRGLCLGAVCDSPAATEALRTTGASRCSSARSPSPDATTRCASPPRSTAARSPTSACTPPT